MAEEEHSDSRYGEGSQNIYAAQALIKFPLLEVRTLVPQLSPLASVCCVVISGYNLWTSDMYPKRFSKSCLMKKPFIAKDPVIIKIFILVVMVMDVRD